MPISWDERVRTLWIGNLPRWADETYLCLCFYQFNSAPHFLPGNNVKIIRDIKTGRPCGYGFMTFETREAAERVLLLYNGLKIMPGTMNKFCLNWACYRFKERISQYKSSGSIESSKYRSTTPLGSIGSSRYRGTTTLQLANSEKQIPKSSNLILSTLPDLPLDVIENILSRLPVKSIVRCRTICKAWASLISATPFIDMHLKNQTNLLDPIVPIESSTEQYNACCIEEDCTYNFINFQFPYGCYPTSPHDTIKNTCQDLFAIPNTFDNLNAISNTCNGLTCVYRSESYDIANVVNSSMQETIQLPKSSSFLKGRMHHIISSIGIGYDDCSDTYKIVRMFEKQKSDLFSYTGAICEVFTLGGATCHWRPLEHIPYHIDTRRSPIFLHGAIYWPMSTTSPWTFTDVVISCNVRTENVRIIPVPEVNRCNKLFVLEESLWTFSAEAYIGYGGNLYVLEDTINCKWVKKHTIAFNPVGAFKHPIANRGGNIFFINFHDIPNWTARHVIVDEYYYDTKSASFKKMDIELNWSQRFLVSYNAIRKYTESLVSPILYLQRSKTPCAVFHIFGQKWATLFPFPSNSIHRRLN